MELDGEIPERGKSAVVLAVDPTVSGLKPWCRR